MTLDCSEKTAAVGKQQVDAMETLKEQITTLTEQVDALSTQRVARRQPSSLLCFRCNQPGHVQRIVSTNQGDVSRADELDILLVSVVRETGAGRLDWAWGAPKGSKPFMCT